ncbi:outer membrane protein assembly factor BamB family protein [Niabella soli]|uniref:Fibronectin type-III domain-containing protein n=1 Tax=Niabella soli DSM 19437 TaxID=929713 RepID=W0F2X1_9BACT|nr:PQQ-binding-like beta-propeller repeat protein [Niabella soli]AHF17390.1 hypothetical protein NIASO_06700 [Niabella soli DSM 19437]
MRKIIQWAFILAGTLLFACSKKTDVRPEEPSQKTEPNNPPAQFAISLSAVAGDTAQIKWTKAVDPDGDLVGYTIYLNNEVKYSNYKDSVLTFKNLKELTEYQVKIVAADKKKNETIATFTFNTPKYWLRFLKKLTYGKIIICAGMVKANDGGGYVLSGLSRINGVEEFFAMKIDSLGNPVWQNYYGEVLEDYFHRKLVSYKNGYVMLGNHYIVKFDNDGNLLWQKKPESFGEVYGITVSDDGEVYVAGCSRWISGVGVKGVLARLDKDGNEIWKSELNSTGADYLCDVAIGADKQLRVVGTYGLAPYPSYWLLKYNAETGRIIWSKVYASVGIPTPNRLIETSEGNIVFTGWLGLVRSMSGVVLKMADPNGNILWDFSSQDLWGWPRGVVQGHDNSLIVYGSTITGDYYQDFGLFQFDKKGNLLWQKKYYEDFAAIINDAVIPTDDGGYIIAATRGDRTSYSGTETQVYIFKTDDKGNFN